MMDKPDIEDIVSAHIELRRVGRELVGLCPFHDDHHPSLFVNPDKQLFLCRACRVGGDVVTFIMEIEGVDFKDACRRLGIERRQPPRRIDTSKRRAAEKLAHWLNAQHLKCGTLLRELSRQLAIAHEIPDQRLASELTHEFDILSDLFEDLQSPAYAEEMLAARTAIEAITKWAEPESLPRFPKWTPTYQDFLRSNLPEGARNNADRKAS